jgi:hypothetical protein
MATSKRKSPGTATNSAEALHKKAHVDITASWLIREIIATLTTGALIAVVMWSSILGMSGNMGPGKDVVVGPVAEVDHDGR